MSLNDIEFVNPENVVIKNEYIRDDESEIDANFTFNANNDSAKCGEIFTSNNIDFMLCCAFCHSIFNTLNEFGEHLRLKHQNPGASFVEEYCKSESEQEFPLPEPIEAEEDEIVCDREVKAPKEAKYACKDCNKRYRYKLSFQRHKCRALLYKKRESIPGGIDDLHQPPEIRLETVVQPDVITPEIDIDINDSIRMKLKQELDVESTANLFKISGVMDSPPEHKYDSSNAEMGHEMDQDHEMGVPNPDLFCDICHRQFKYKNVFRRHGMQHEIGPLALRKDPNYRKCIECGLEFTNNAEWLEHELNHPKIKPFQCTFCQKKFKTNSELEAHTKNHTVEGPVKCEQCGADFVRYKNLLSHINRVHLQVKPFACTLCDKRFPQNAELRVHMRRHTGEKPYQCEECGQSFMVATKLNEHLKRHAGVRDVQCPVCPMAFVTKKMLRKHMVKHSTERPHVCATCGNTFSRRKALLAHVKIHKEVKEYVCNLCGKAFAQHAGLYMHRKTHLND